MSLYILLSLILVVGKCWGPEKVDYLTRIIHFKAWHETPKQKRESVVDDPADHWTEFGDYPSVLSENKE
jgi:hypothetical protein